MEVVSAGYLSEKVFKKQFESCFKQYFKPLCFYAMSFVRDDEVAKDIVHDVFLLVWRHRLKIDFSQPMFPYFLSLTRNCSLNYLAHLKVKSRHEVFRSGVQEWSREPDYGEHEELIRNIIERIDHLPGRCAEVMRLCFVECKKYKEVADLLDISVNTVKTHVSAGLKILRNEFPASLLFIFLFRRK